MAWSPAFLAALESRQRQIRYLLEVQAVYQEPGSAWSVSSFPVAGSDLRLSVHDVDVQGSSLSTRGWSTTFGAWSVVLNGEIRAFLARVTRGTICRLRVGFDGMATVDFATVAVGQFRNLRGRPPAYRAEFLDLYSALRQRLQTAYSVSLLFDGVGTGTTLAAAYTPGDTSIQVSSTTGFEREGGGSGALLITPTSGDPFWLTWTGTATGPTRFTGVSSAGQMGTTAVAAAVGNEVTEAAYLSGHPLDIARKVLCSRDGTNGAYDTLPAYWGMAMLDALVDHADIADQKTYMAPATGSYAWAYAQTEVVEDAWSWLTGFLAPAGCFFALRQGQLTIRCGRAVTTAARPWSITDADIAEVEDYEAFAGSHAEEYHGILVAADPSSGSSGSSDYTSGVATLPYLREITYDQSDRLFANGTEVATKDVARLKEDARRVPERLVVSCAGLRLAQLTVGDVVSLTTRRAWSRHDGREFANRPGLVVEVSPGWSRGTVRVTLQIYPPDDAVFS